MVLTLTVTFLLSFCFLFGEQARGYIGRYCTYTGDGFQEGVSLTAADEVIRLRKYAYGSCEIMLNQFVASGDFAVDFNRTIVEWVASELGLVFTCRP